MALVTTQGFDLFGTPRQSAASGFQALEQARALGQRNLLADREDQVRQALSGLSSPQMQPQTDQQQMLAEQSAPFVGSELAQREQPKAVTSMQEKMDLARSIDPATANKIFKDLGIDDQSRKSEMSSWAATVENLPEEQFQSAVRTRSENLRAQGRDSSHTDMLIDMDKETRANALLGVQLADLSTKERFGVQAQQDRQRQATQKSFAPITIINPETGEKRLVSPTIDNLTGEGTLSPFDVPSGFVIADETDQESRSADLAAKIKEEREKAGIKKETVQDIKFMEKLGEEASGIYAKLQKAAQDASRFIPRLEGLKKLSQEVRTGTGANISMIAKRVLGFEGAANMEVLNAQLGELAQDILNQQTGTKTDFDFENAVKQAASLGKTNEANAMLIDALINRQQEAVDFGNQAKKAYKESGVKGILDMRYQLPVTTETPPAISSVKFLGFE